MFFLYLLGTYIIGSIPFGLMISFLGYDTDIRQVGSGNIGMTNVHRTVGTKAAILNIARRRWQRVDDGHVRSRKGCQ